MHLEFADRGFAAYTMLRGPSSSPRLFRSMKRSLIALLPFLLLSCGDGSKGIVTPPPAAPTTLDVSEITLTALGTSEQVVARSGSQSAPPRLEVVEEQRWLSESQVLNPQGFSTGKVMASAPGTVLLHAHAFGNPPVPLRVHVRPTGIVHLSTTAPARRLGVGDTLVLRGYRMNELGASQVALKGASLALQGGDSATARASITSLGDPQSCGGSAKTSFVLQNALSLDTTSLWLQRSGELSLGVGQARVISTKELECLRLPPLPGSRYAVAYLDTRLWSADSSGAIYSFSYPWPTSITSAPVITLSDLSSLGGGINTSRAPVFQRSVAASTTATAPDPSWPQLFDRETPWKVGETFKIRTFESPSDSTTVRIVRVYDNRYVLATADSVPDTERIIATIDTAMVHFLAHSEPLLKEVASPRRIVTSYGSGQYMFLLRNMPMAGSVFGLGDRHVALISNLPHALPLFYFEVMTHEAAHTWHTNYLYDLWGGVGRAAGFMSWDREGFATFRQVEAVRRALAIAPEANWNFRPFMGSQSREVSYARHASGLIGDLRQGYHPMASFLLDQVQRRVSAGEPRSSAVIAVGRGSMEGTFGRDSQGTRYPGVIGRQKALLGSNWNFTSEVLDWTLRIAADDLTSGPYQNPLFLRAAASEGELGWRPALSVQLGLGGSSSATVRYGSSGFVYLKDNQIGSTVRLVSDVPNTVWKIIRID